MTSRSAGRNPSALDLLVDAEHHDASPTLHLINEMMGLASHLPDDLVPFEMSEEMTRQMHENFERKTKKRLRDDVEGTPSKRLRSSARLQRDGLNTSTDFDPFAVPRPREESREREQKELKEKEREKEKEKEQKEKEKEKEQKEKEKDLRERERGRPAVRDEAPGQRPTSSVRPQVNEDDLPALMAEAKRLKHEGDQRRKDAKTNDVLLDKFLANYLEASLFYLRCGQYYEKHQKRDWIESAKKLYEDTAKLAQFAASQVRFPCSAKRRTLTALLEKSIAVCYSRKLSLEKKQLQVLIHAGSSSDAEDKMSSALSALERTANEAAACWLRSRRSDSSLPEMEGEFERPLQISSSDFIRYAERNLASLPSS